MSIHTGRAAPQGMHVCWLYVLVVGVCVICTSGKMHGHRGGGIVPRMGMQMWQRVDRRTPKKGGIDLLILLPTTSLPTFIVPQTKATHTPIHPPNQRRTLPCHLSSTKPNHCHSGVRGGVGAQAPLRPHARLLCGFRGGGQQGMWVSVCVWIEGRINRDTHTCIHAHRVMLTAHLPPVTHHPSFRMSSGLSHTPPPPHISLNHSAIPLQHTNERCGARTSRRTCRGCGGSTSGP